MTALSAEDKSGLRDIVSQPRHLPAHSEILPPDRTAPAIYIVLQGFACRLKRLDDGRRQIAAYLMPGDICDYHFLSGDPLDYGVVTLTSASVATIRLEPFVDLAERQLPITRAIMRSASIDEAIAREWLISLGQRTAVQRVAHQFCEFYVRLARVGQTRGATFSMPLTQAELGEALGLSTVHVNRTMQELRRADLISTRGGHVTLHHIEELAQTGLFNPSYLGVSEDFWSELKAQVPAASLV